MNKSFALFGIILALSVFVVGCSSEISAESKSPTLQPTPSEPVPEAQNEVVSDIVVTDETEVELGELI